MQETPNGEMTVSLDLGLVPEWIRRALSYPRCRQQQCWSSVRRYDREDTSFLSPTRFIGWEVRNHLQLLTLDTGPRLGLSATPRRAGDPTGTMRIFDYFNGIVPPPFTLKDAIKSGSLTPYFYHVHTVTLTETEEEHWNETTKRIRRISAQNASAKVENSPSERQIERMTTSDHELLQTIEQIRKESFPELPADLVNKLSRSKRLH